MGIRPGLRAVVLPSPTSTLPQAVVAGILAQHGAELAAKLPGLLGRLHELVTAQPPDLLLATLSIKNLIVGTQDRKDLHDNPVLSHLELLQAFALAHAPDDYPNFYSPVAPAGPPLADIEQVVAEAHAAFAMMRLKDVVGPDGKPRLAPDVPALEYMRLHTQNVRIPGYPYQIENAVGAVLGNMGGALRDALGVTPREAVQCLHSLRKLVADRLFVHLTAMRRVLGERALDPLLIRYHKEFPDLIGDPLEGKEMFANFPDPVNVAKEFLCAHSAFRMAHHLEVSAADVSSYAEGGLSEAAAATLLRAWSMSFGDLKGKNPEHFFLDNPVWRRPFIHLERGTYLIVNPVAHHAFPWLMTESLTGPVPSLAKRYPDARSDFLEEKMSAILQRAFPSGQHLRNAKWKHPTSGDEFETDHVCLVGSVLLVAEAKSGKVQGATLRGAPASLRDNVYSMMTYPSLQSKRLSDAILSSPGGVELRADDGRRLLLTRVSVRIIVRVNVTLDVLGLLLTRWRDLRDAGIIDEEHERSMAPTLPLFDLDVVSRVLRSEGALAHYLFRRDYIERALNYHGDELDLLAFYLETGFSIADKRATESRCDISTLSRRFDKEFLHDEEPLPEAAMPKPRMTKFWRDLIARVEAHNSDARIIASMMLRDVAPELQGRLEKSKETAKANVRKYRTARDNVFEVVTGHDADRAVILFVAHDDSPGLRRRETAEAAANHAAETNDAKRVLAFWYHADREEYPYGGMGLFFYDGVQPTAEGGDRGGTAPPTD